MTVPDWLAVACVTVAAGFFLAGTVGLLRFPDTLCRLHALTKADNVALGLLCLGLAIHDGTFSGVLTLAFVWLFAIIASTVSAFLIAGWERQQPDDHSAL